MLVRRETKNKLITLPSIQTPDKIVLMDRITNVLWVNHVPFTTSTTFAGLGCMRNWNHLDQPILSFTSAVRFCLIAFEQFTCKSTLHDSLPSGPTCISHHQQLNWLRGPQLSNMDSEASRTSRRCRQLYFCY